MDYYEDIKNELINNEINKKVKSYSINKSDLDTYYNVGRMLSEAGKHYGEGIIKEYSKRLTIELGKGYSQRNLRNMRQLYLVFEKWQSVPAKTNWTNYYEIIWFEYNKFSYYENLCCQYNLSSRKLKEKIKSNEYERLSVETRNKMISNDSVSITDLVPNPIIIKSNDIEIYSEKILHKLIVDNIESFMESLGNNYSFIKSEYKIKVDNKFNYIDLLLFNYEFNCFVVVELKVCELKKEHIGQILIYMNYIDKNIKRINHDKTIGIIICKKNDEYVIEYCSDKRIISREYKTI